MASWLAALNSLLPRWSAPAAQPLPDVGSKAPTAIEQADLPNGTTPPRPHLVAFVRHCGCPFAAKEVRLLAEQVQEHKDLHVIIVQHSEQKETEQWFEQIGAKAAFPDPSRYTLVADPERKLYAAWGIGTVGWTGMVNLSLLGKLQELQRVDKIKLTPTGKGSWRWGNSGGFAVDKTGVVRWRKLAEDAGDMCDYAQAAQTVV